jgi:hypothetical protein
VYKDWVGEDWASAAGATAAPAAIVTNAKNAITSLLHLISRTYSPNSATLGRAGVIGTDAATVRF